MLERHLHELQRFYGVLPSPPRDPFALFVWEVLSAHTVPFKRDAAIAALKRIPALTPDAIARAPQKKLQESVALAGPYQERRMGALRTGADVFRRAPNLPATIRGQLIAARRALKSLPQMGDGGAYRMLLFAGGHPVMPVDAKVSRVARRLGFGGRAGVSTKTTRSVRDVLSRELSCTADGYQRAYIYLSHHAGATCTESDPHCTICPLFQDCPWANSAKRRAGGAS